MYNNEKKKLFNELFFIYYLYVSFINEKNIEEVILFFVIRFCIKN